MQTEPSAIAMPKHMGTIEIVNRTTEIRDDRWAYALPCLQVAMSQHFAPKWGVDYTLALIGKAQQPTPTACKLWLVDRSTEAGALGFHSVGDDGMPYGQIAVLDDIEDGVEITVTLDHELKELAADPDAKRVVGPDEQGRWYSVECADPVEDDRDGYMCTDTKTGNVIRCSNFVCPRYYGLPNFDGSDAIDFMGKMNATVPGLLDGGYQEFYTKGQGWGSIQSRLPSGHASVRSRHAEGRSTVRASKHFDAMVVEQSTVAKLLY